MSISVHHRIKELIEETNDAYDICVSCEHVNTDYAEFAALSLPEFKTALSKPDLTSNQLVEMLRKGRNKYAKNTPKANWAMFLAGYVTNKSNGNDRKFRIRESWLQEAK